MFKGYTAGAFDRSPQDAKERLEFLHQKNTNELWQVLRKASEMLIAFCHYIHDEDGPDFNGNSVAELTDLLQRL